MPPAKLLALAALATLASAAPSPPRARVLALTERVGELRASYSTLAAALDSWGFTVDERAVDDPALRVRVWDDWLYDKLLVVPGAKDFGGALSAAAVVAFVESGRDVFLALSPAATSDMRALAAAFGADPEPAGSRALAPTACAGGDAATLLAPVTGPAPMVGAAEGGIVAFRGTGFTVAPAAKTVWPSLVAPAAAVSSAAATSGKPAAAGAALALVVGAQTRANARFLVSGSADVFSDAAAGPVTACAGGDATPTANAAFAVATLAWAFNEAGSLVASPLRHSLADPKKAAAHPSGNPTREGDAPYRITDAVTVALDVAERTPGGGLRPYAPVDDVQVEFTMMDPHVRTFLNPVAAGVERNATAPALTASTPDPRFATLAATFTAPDVYGIFKLALHHARPGWSFVDEETLAPLRPFNHDEYDRFLPAAAPYYTAAASVSVAFFVACAVALWSE